MLNNQKGLRALVLGASGAVGRDLVQDLIKSSEWIQITIIVRRTLPEWESDDYKIHNKLKIIKVESLDELENIEKWSFQNIDSIFCVIGSHPNLGEALYIKVDHDYALYMAKIAQKNNIPHFSLLTGQGANKNSNFFMYRVKGQIEDQIINLKLQRTSIFRPGLITERVNDYRLYEKIFAYIPFIPKIKSKDLSKAMIMDAYNKQEIKIYEHRDILNSIK